MKRPLKAVVLVLVLSAALGARGAFANDGKPCTGPVPASDAGPSVTALSVDDLREQVRKTEIAFAKTMADRDPKAFVSFLADEAIFVGSRRVLRGKSAIAEGWKSLYEGPNAPFSWAPEKVEVVDSGTLALSSGPVFDPAGKRIGTFNSTWRLEGNGSWKIVLDNGCPDCDCGSDKAEKADKPEKTGKK
jgi:ketosteroid isomerase-like protein